MEFLFQQRHAGRTRRSTRNRRRRRGEIMYHPAGDNDAEEFIELYNASPDDVDLTGWKIRGGVRYDFPTGETLAAGAYLVVAHDPDSVNVKYALEDSLGPFDARRLSNRGENLSLRDALRNVVDEVFYRDRDGGANSRQGRRWLGCGRRRWTTLSELDGEQRCL